MHNTESPVSEESILSYVRQHLGEVIGDPEMLSTKIDMNTKFSSDLELESIEFVVLASRLRAEFGERINFVEFMSTKTVDEVVSLTVGDLVRHVETCLTKDQSLQEHSSNA